MRRRFVVALLSFVISHNLHRRHLEKGQRAMIAAEIANMRRGYNNAEESAEPRIGHKEAAKLMGVGTRTVEDAAKVKKDGVPELVEMVKSGKVGPDPAAQVAKLPQEEQRAVVAQGPEAVREKEGRAYFFTTCRCRSAIAFSSSTT